jgi:uncharacterized protein
MTLGPLTSSPATTTRFTRSLMWQRMDGAGTDIVMVAGTSAIDGHGTVTAARPLPHVLRYELSTDASGAVEAVEVVAEGAGWTRLLTMRRDGRHWQVSTEETGDLDRALTDAGHAAVPLPGIEDWSTGASPGRCSP